MSKIDFQQHLDLTSIETTRIKMPDYFDPLSAAETGAVFCLVHDILNNPDFVHQEYLDAETQHYSANVKVAFVQFLGEELSRMVRN